MVDYSAALVDTDETVTILDFIKEASGDLGCDNDYTLRNNVNSAFRILEQHLNNKLVAQSVTERFETDKTQIKLRYWPASNLSAVSRDGVDVTAEFSLYVQDGLAWVTDADSKYCWNRLSRFEQFDVTYTAGFDPVPLDIVYAAKEFAEQIGRVSGPGTVKRESIVGVGSVEYVTSDMAGGIVPGSIASILEHYRAIHV